MDSSAFNRIGDAMCAFFAMAFFGVCVSVGAILSFVAMLFGYNVAAEVLLGLGFISGAAWGTITYLKR